MADDFESRVSRISYDLAKKDQNFVEEKDNNDQEKLKRILFLSNTNRETIIMQVNKIINDLKRNPDFNVTTETREDILNVMEQHLQAGNLDSISQIKDEEFVKTAIVEPMVKNDTEYTRAVSDMIESSYIKESEIILTASIIDQLMTGNLSDEKLDNIFSIFQNSPEIIRRNISCMDGLINNENGDKNTALIIHFEDSKESLNYFRQHRGTHADRGALIDILKYATNNDKVLQEEALLIASKVDMNDLIKSDGTIDISETCRRLQESVKDDPKLLERFSTEEKIMDEVEQIKERTLNNTVKQYCKDSYFSKEWKKCKTEEEKNELLKGYRAERKRETELMHDINLSKNSIENEKEIKEKIAILLQGHRENKKELTEKLVEGTPMEANLRKFIEDTLSKGEKTLNNSDAHNSDER